MILYKGPSMLDGKPIVAIATGLEHKSRNAKVGAGMVQVWILREDIAPHEAIQTGDDASICGACPHRGTIEDGRNVGRSCYVVTFRGPLSIYNAYKRGVYRELLDGSPSMPLANRGVRLGAYGDPAAVPFHVWNCWLARAAFVTGYTHQWASFPELALWCMASCDSASERAQAKLLGFRTFRVRGASEPIETREVVCPASSEAGKRSSCEECRACGGKSAKAKADIVILAHGAVGKVNAFNARIAA